MNKKEICPVCKRKLRSNRFLYNRLKKTRICKQCDKRIGNNKFCVPITKKLDRMGNYSINELEKKDYGKNMLIKDTVIKWHGEKFMLL